VPNTVPIGWFASPNAKINLGLHITSNGKTGISEIETCMVPIPLYDALEIIIDPKKTTFELHRKWKYWKPTDYLIPKGLFRPAWSRISPGLPAAQIHCIKLFLWAQDWVVDQQMCFLLDADGIIFLICFWMISAMKNMHVNSCGSDCALFLWKHSKNRKTGRGEDSKNRSIGSQGTHLVVFNPGIIIGLQRSLMLE